MACRCQTIASGNEGCKSGSASGSRNETGWSQPCKTIDDNLQNNVQLASSLCIHHFTHIVTVAAGHPCPTWSLMHPTLPNNHSI